MNKEFERSTERSMPFGMQVLSDLLKGSHEGVDLRHELFVGARWTWDFLCSTAMLRLHPRSSRQSGQNPLRQTMYREGCAIPRYKHSFRDYLDHDNLVSQKLILDVGLPVHWMTIRYLFLKQASLPELYRDFIGLTEPEAYYRDDVVIDQLFNGFWPLTFAKDTTKTREFYWEQRFDRYDIGGLGELPGFRFQIDFCNDVPELKSITFYPRKDQRSDPDPSLIRTPQHAESWELAKRTALGLWHYVGTLHRHAVGGHLNMEQYLIALLRNVRPGNPLYGLLYPHLKGCQGVNLVSLDRVVLARKSMYATAGPFTMDSMMAFVTDSIGQYDWKGWRPPPPMGRFHSHANAANVYWSILTEYVDRYFQLRADGFVSGWPEIDAFCRELTEHSVRKDDGSPSISPISEASHEQKIRDLKEICRYVIYWVTYEHSHLHESVVLPYLYCQTIQESTEEYERIVGSYEWRKAAVKMLFLIRVFREVEEFMRTRKFKSVLRNVDGDIPELFLRILIRRKPELDAVGYDATKLLQIVI